jgi:hypothetical protein
MENTNLTFVAHWSNTNMYEYRPYKLWLAYGIAITSSFVGVLLGLHALWLNGASHDNSFFSIMASMRKGFLDELTLGHSLGTTPMLRKILLTKLRFGELGEDMGEPGEVMKKGRPRAGLGVEQASQPLKKGQFVY